MWKTQNPYVICATTDIHGPGFYPLGVWKYHWNGFLDRDNEAQQLVNATNNWNSYNEEQKSDLKRQLEIIFFGIFKPCWDEDSWIEDNLIITHVFPNLIRARFEKKNTTVRFYFTPPKIPHNGTDVKIEINCTRTRFEDTTPSACFSIREQRL
jgi:hypothetical protein